LSTSSTLVHVPFVPESGFLRSEPNYPISVSASVVHGADYIKVDPSGTVARLEVQSTLRTAGGFIRYNYTGIVDLTSPAGKVLRGEADATTTPFGFLFARPTFETGVAGLKELENKVYVASGRFVLEDGKPVVVEYKISEVVA
jgi:hypothetical protein